MPRDCCSAHTSLPRTTVVHIRSGYDVYIGRAMPGLAASIFANDFRIGVHGTRAEVIAMYKEYILKRLEAEPALRAELEKLRGKRLGCWCKPQACHGDILVELLEGIPPAPPEQFSLF